MAQPLAAALTFISGQFGAIAQLGERIVRNDEVGGSIPPGSTSLRRLRQLRLGKPHRSEGCRGVARRAKPGCFSNHTSQLRFGKPYRVEVCRGRVYSAACAIAGIGTCASQSIMNCFSQARSVTS